MKRARRWRWWGKWALSLGCGLIMLVWIASGFRSVTWSFDTTSRSLSTTLAFGRLGVGVYKRGPGLPRYTTPVGVEVQRIFGTPWRDRWLGEWSWSADPVGTVIIFPLWPFAVLSASTSIALVLLDRRLPNHCPRCNYDLTGSPPGPCPECGAVRERAGRAP